MKNAALMTSYCLLLAVSACGGDDVPAECIDCSPEDEADGDPTACRTPEEAGYTTRTGEASILDDDISVGTPSPLDFDLDGDVDLVASSSGEDSTLRFYANDGQGTFSLAAAQTDQHIPSEGGWQTIDLDGDDIKEIVTFVGDLHQPSLQIWTNNNGTKFVKTFSIDFEKIRAIESQAFADINNDNQLDLVGIVIDSADDTKRILTMVSNGDSYEQGSTEVDGNPIDILAGDVDKDGYLDIAFEQSSRNTKTVDIFRGDGTGKFAFHTNIDIRYIIGGFSSLADLDGDSAVEYVDWGGCYYEVGASLEVGEKTCPNGGRVSVANNPWKDGDFDGDKDFMGRDVGDQDEGESSTIYYIENVGGGNWQPTVSDLCMEGIVRGAYPADFNQDGRMDFIANVDNPATSTWTTRSHLFLSN
jgi:hypothetical protein